MNKIDKQAIKKAKWLANYCSKHNQNCRGCILLINHVSDSGSCRICLLEKDIPRDWVDDLRSIEEK